MKPGPTVGLLRTFGSIILIFSALSACHSPDDPGSRPSGYITHGIDSWTNDIPVCFLNTEADYQALVLTIRQAVEEEYAPLGFHFSGWQACNKGNQARSVQVKFDPNSSTSWVQDFGPSLLGLNPGIVLGLNHECKVEYPGSNCMKNIAIHEFGHVLGLRHEMNRRDQDGCSQDQTGGYGEFDAIQIGEYDPESIMNYCWLDKLNAKNQRAYLSDGDRLTLRELKAGRLAMFDRMPDLVEPAQTTSFLVTGEQLLNYQLHIGLEQETDCTLADNYDPQLRPLDQPISPVDFNQLPLGFRLKVCARGQHFDGSWQDLDAYSSMIFALENPDDREDPMLVQTISAPKKVTSGQDFSIHLKIEDQSQIQRVVLTAEPAGQNSAIRPIQIYNEPTMLGDGHYRLDISGKHLSVNGDYIVRRIEIQDMMGYRSNWFADTQLGLYADSQAELIRFQVQGGMNYSNQVPEVRRIVSFPSSFSVQSSFEMVLDIDYANPISEVFIELKHSELDQILSLFPISKREGKNGHYHLRFALEGQIAYSGTYHLATISVTDFFGHQTYLASDFPGQALEPSRIIAPNIKVADGLSYETNPPKLLALTNVPKSIRFDQQSKFRLTVQDESKIDFVDVVVEHLDTQISLFTTTRLLSRLSDNRHEFEVAIDAMDFHPTGRYEIKLIRIIDIHGNESVYMRDSARGVYQNTSIPVPLLDLLTY